MRISFRFLLLVAGLLALPAAARAQSTPTDSAFAVSKAGTSLLRVNQNGNVGVGTSTPDRRLSVNGAIGATDTIATGVGIKFPDGTLQTTAALNATGTSSNTPNTLVKRDSTGSFAAGKATLDSLSVTGRTATGRLVAGDTVSTSAGFKFPDGSVQTTAATSATGTSANTPNTLVQRNANGGFSAGKISADSVSVAGRATLGSGDVVVERTSVLASDNDSIFTVRNGTTYGFRVNRDGGVLARGYYNGSPSGSGVPAEGAGLRMMWYPGKAAFRAGSINGTQWDDANIGPWSVAMGQDVRALGDYAFAGGARAVAANTGTFAFGEDVTATGANSVVMGYKASTSTNLGSPKLGTFVFGDRSTNLTGDTVHATTTNAAFWRVANGFYIWTAANLSSGVAIQSGNGTSVTWANCTINDAMISASNCAYLSSGGTWTNSSDRNRKHAFARVSGEDVLARLRGVPIATWTYNSDQEQVRHLGPTAQDFHAAFGLNGADDKHIATVDADGVALVAAQALDARTQAQQARIEALERENAELRARLDRIERMLRAAPAQP